jgi:ubiquinone/menaquinone biosynthesis C-methylase UbiE
MPPSRARIAKIVLAAGCRRVMMALHGRSRSEEWGQRLQAPPRRFRESRLLGDARALSPNQSRPSSAAHEIPDLGPEVYRNWRASSVGAITETLQRRLILELLGDVRGRTILDVGCGDGALAIELHRRGGIVVGIDVSSAMIKVARASARRQDGADIAFVVASAEALPFTAEHFDIVVAVTMLCFAPEDAAAAPVFGEIARVLRRRGRLVIGELGKWSSWAMARHIRARLGSRLWRQARFRTARELQALARQAGLVPGPARGAIYYPRWAPAARLLARWDPAFSRFGTIGAAFLALAAQKDR